MRLKAARTIALESGKEYLQRVGRSQKMREGRQEQRKDLPRGLRQVTHPPETLHDFKPGSKGKTLAEKIVEGLHAEINHGRRFTATTLLGQYLLDAALLYEAMSTYRDQQILDQFLYNDPPLHPRRTLDQSYYRGLKNTSQRDRDQVVYRGTSMNLETRHRLLQQPAVSTAGTISARPHSWRWSINSGCGF